MTAATLALMDQYAAGMLADMREAFDSDRTMFLRCLGSVAAQANLIMDAAGKAENWPALFTSWVQHLGVRVVAENVLAWQETPE